MTTEFVIGIGREAILITLMVSAPMLVFGLVVGLAVSILQAVTQVHEMTLIFIPKIIAVALALLIFLPWILNKVVDFTAKLINSIPNIAM
ncbi:MAG: flagellar biosynthesis protein FliQ [candidate division Zixibacteria bacterium]|nr:flagellar biosynthesis protein FliQ [candidate division Zixibacteria bacterium]